MRIPINCTRGSETLTGGGTKVYISISLGDAGRGLDN